MTPKSSTAADICFSDSALRLLRSDVQDGSTMVAVARAILSGQYPAEVYESGAFDVFQLVADESEDIVLSEFGEFDTLPKYVRSQPKPEQDARLLTIFNFYKFTFNEALAAFRNSIMNHGQ